MIINLTELTNQTGPICKKYEVIEDKVEIRPCANVHSAVGRTLTLEDTEISNYFDSLAKENNKCVVLGVWEGSKDWMEYDVVVSNDPKKDPNAGVISRSSEFYKYSNNDTISLMLLDFDSESDDRELFFDELEVALSDSLINGNKILHWKRPSTSSSISINGKTGNGQHIYIAVKNANQKLIELIHRFCWLQNYGGDYKITKSGSVLPVSLIDPAVKTPERINYSSDAVAEVTNSPNTTVELLDRPCVKAGNAVIDCELAIAILEELTIDFKSAWRDKKSNVEKTDEVRQVKENWKADQIETKVASGIPHKQAKLEAEALSNQVLLSSDYIYKSDGTEIQVAEVLKYPDTWNGMKGFCDPIKKNFGRNTAMIMRFDGRLVLKSFNGGGRYFWLKWAAEDLQAYVDELSDSELEDHIGELINNSNLNGIKRKALIKSVAKRLGVAGGDVEAVVKDERLNEFVTEVVGSDAEDETEDEKRWIGCEEDASHNAIIKSYLYNSGACKGFAGSLYVWGSTIWKKQTEGYIKSVIGERYENVAICRRVGDYSSLAKAITSWDSVLVDEWKQKIGFPCTDGFWSVEGDKVVRVDYKKEFNCRYKIKCAPDFNYEGQMPYFQKILDNVDSPELFQQICGLASCGKLADLQKVAIFQGTGGAGKGTVSRVISSLFPKNRVTSIGLDQMNNEKYTIELMDSVLNVVPEQDKAGKKIKMTGFRALTGGDTVSAWKLYGGVVAFKPSCSHILNVNNWPTVDGAGEELRRRVGETIVRFSKNNQEQVVELDKKIIENELPKILGWLIDGVQLYLAGGLAPGYSMRHYESWVSSFDPIELFISEQMITDSRARVVRSEIWTRFCKFCEESNYYPMKKGEFFDALKEHRYYRGESMTMGSVTVRGLAWK